MLVTATTHPETSQDQTGFSLLELLSGASDPEPAAAIQIGDRSLRPSVVFDTYWRFAALRQSIYLHRLWRPYPPATDDAILRTHRFTNVYRASDRVSQYLISSVQSGPLSSPVPEDLMFRTLLFKVFNRQQTWEMLEALVGPVRWSSYVFETYRDALDECARRGPIYSAAYVMPCPRLGENRKHSNHLRLLEMMMRDGLTEVLTTAPSLRAVFDHLVAYPGLGPFLAFQYAIDLNYSDLLAFDEDDFVVAGPGAKDGIRKCFGPAAGGREADVIRYMVDAQEDHFARLGISFPGLFGRRLHLIDAQNLFCEVDKYARIRHPNIDGISGRSRIKQKFQPAGPLAKPVFPSRWRLDATISELALDVLDSSRIEVNANTSTVVPSEIPPGGIAGEDCTLPF